MADEPLAPPPHHLLKYFSYTHLPSALADVSKPFHALAQKLDYELPACGQKDAALQKLLEAKDCAVRARVNP